MSKNLVSINEKEMTIREYQGQRVVTFKDITPAHGKKDGTAQTSFKRNKKHFIENVDFVMIHPIGTNCTDRNNHNVTNRKISGIDTIPNRGLTLFTESGYLMIAKTFTDDLAWQVQRQLVNGYFKARAEQRFEIPERQTSSLPAPVAKTWYDRNRPRLYEIGRKYNCNMKTIIKHILVHLNSKFDIKEAKKIYREQTGHDLEYNLDLLDFFPEMEEVADRFVDKMLSE